MHLQTKHFPTSCINSGKPYSGELMQQYLLTNDFPIFLFLAKNVTRVRWIKEEEVEIRKLFANNFCKRKCPKQRDCEVAITQSKLAGGHIQRRYWETLKKQVYNMIKKQPTA